MKKIYTIILFTFFAFLSKAQYTLTTANNPVIGDIEKTWAADTTGISLMASASGTGQTWVYSNIVVPSSVTPVASTYVAASSAPNSSAFGSANMAKTSDNTNYEMSNYGSSITMYGSSNPTLTIVYQDPEVIANLPFTFAGFSTDTYSASYTSGTVSVVRTGTISVLGDGTGTLYLPASQTYPNCLRLKLNLTQKEVWPTYTSTINVLQYVYFNSSNKQSLLAVGQTTFAASTTTTTFKGKIVSVNDRALYSGINELKGNETNFSLYPNPASNTANIWFVPINTESYDLSITNSLGQTVRSTSYPNLNPGTYNIAVDLKGLPSGIYYVKLKDSKQEGVKKLIIE